MPRNGGPPSPPNARPNLKLKRSMLGVEHLRVLEPGTPLSGYCAISGTDSATTPRVLRVTDLGTESSVITLLRPLG